MLILRLILVAAAVMVAVTAQSQGQFLFNTRNTIAGNDVMFLGCGGPETGSDAFVEVLAGPSVAELTALTPLLPLNRSGTGAGYPQPFGATYNAPAGSTVIAYRAYQGAWYGTAITRSDIYTVTVMLDANNNPVPLMLPTDPTTPPPELFLGRQRVQMCLVAEPAVWTMLLVGGVGLLVFVQGRARERMPCR